MNIKLTHPIKINKERFIKNVKYVEKYDDYALWSINLLDKDRIEVLQIKYIVTSKGREIKSKNFYKDFEKLKSLIV